MNYGHVYNSQPSPSLQPVSPPQVLISDHSTGIPYVISPYRPPGVPFVPVLSASVGPTTIPCTTPASVLPPSPPPVLSTQLPHVFISDHSEVPASLELRTLPNPDVEVNVPSGEDSSVTKAIPTIVRRASEPADVLSCSQYRTEFDSKLRPELQRYQSTTQTSNHWLKRVVVLLICGLVVGLAFKIGIELWKASYGEDESTNQIVHE